MTILTRLSVGIAERRNMINMVDFAGKVCGMDKNDWEVRELDSSISKAFLTLPKCVPWRLADFIINDLKYRKFNYDLEEISDMIKFSQHYHVNDQSGKDSCKTCGHDLRHKIHFRN